MLSGFVTCALSLLMGAGIAFQCQAEEKSSLSSVHEAVRTKGFLGVMVNAVCPEVRAQLMLPPGEGLAVKMVAFKSPAEKAGIKEYDILLHVKNQRLTSQAQFVSLVESCGPGAQVEIGWIHQGVEKKAEIILGEIEILNADPHPDVTPFNAMEWTEKLNGIFQTLRENPALVEAVDRMLHGPAEGTGDPEWLSRLPLKLERGFRMVCRDSEGSVEICESGGQRFVRVFDLTEKLVFKGCFNTPEEKASVPPAIRIRLEKAEAACRELTREKKDAGPSPKSSELPLPGEAPP